MKSKNSDCWYTPPQIVDLIQQCLNGITLDPCADDEKHVEACQHFTVDDDGLSHEWSGRVFLNPPYSCPGVWIAKLQEEFNCGRVEEAIALVPVATDTKWFHPLIASNLICFWKGRIKFLDTNYKPKMAARQSHCLIYWGKNQSRFRQIFSPFGTFNFLEEKGAMSTTTPKENAECNSNTPASSQELEALTSELMPPEHQTESLLNSSKLDLYICNSSSSVGKITEVWQTCFTVDWSGEIKCYFWERDNQLIGKLAIAPQALVDKFFSQGETLKAIEDNQPQLCTKCFKVVDRSYTCDKCLPMRCTQQLNDVHCPSCESPLIKLNDGCGVCGWIPENFLEESNEGVGLKQSSKRRQRKGCLYKYIENKKLKSGSIVSYPRVIGHRHPDNPTHWRWGFNWEEKVDGEWKGRSFGCVPVGAIALIQSMQNEGVSLEQIIGFIKRAKAKK